MKLSSDLVKKILRNCWGSISLALNCIRFVDDQADGLWESLTVKEEALSSIIEKHCKDQGPIIDLGTEWPGVERAMRKILGSNFSTSGSVGWSIA